MEKEELMRKAIELSIENVANGGGPFGAVIAKDGEIIATGVNRVTSQCRPYRPCGSQRHPCGGKQTRNIQLERM